MDEPKKPVENPESKPVERRKIGDDKIHHRVRHPLTLYVDKIEFEPDVNFGDVTRSAYDLELTKYEMIKLRDYLKERLEQKTVISARIRVTGRLVS